MRCVLLVVYAYIRRHNSHYYGNRRKTDVEALSKADKRIVRLQNFPFYEKYGHMAIRS